MWRRILLAVLLSLILSLIPIAAMAANPIVTITVSAFIVGFPGNFSITYISDTEVELNWVKPADVDKTMVRVKLGSAPVDRNDGYLVYYDTGETFTDTNIDLTASRIPVYRAWSQRNDGAWEPLGATGEANFMTLSFLFVGLILLSLGFTISSYIFKKGMLAFTGTGVWLITALFCFQQSTEIWDVYQCLALLFIGLTIACAFSPLAYRETTPASEEPEDPDMVEMQKEVLAMQRQRTMFSSLASKQRPRAKRHLTRFERTGEE